MAAVDELSQLKRLLIGQEQQSLERLQERVERTGTRAQDVAEVLAESFELKQDDTERLSVAMRAPVKQCISSTVREDPQEFADALFPVMGPAIRRAVSESISALSEKINRALERSFSVQGIKWRIESARTGVPVSQIILRDTFIYRVDEAFVIQRDSGLLISHVSRDASSAQDSDAVSAMLTAIQDFVHDSFSGEEGSELDTIRVGEQVVWIFRGPEFTTAALIAGQPPREMRSIFQEVTESIQLEYGEAIKAFGGNQSADDAMIDGVRLLLQPLLESEIQRKSQSARTANSFRPLLILSFLVIAVIATWLISRYIENSRLLELTEKIAATPGIELISIEPGSPHVMRAFRDPLAAGLPELLQGSKFTADDIHIDFIPFQSLESPIVIRRLAHLFSPPDTVNMSVEDGVLHVSGYSPASYVNRLRGFPLTVFGISEIDTSELNREQLDVVERLRAELDVPQSVTMTFKEGVVTANGQAPYEWLQMARSYQADIPSVKSIELGNVAVDPLSVESYLRTVTNAPELVSLQIRNRQLFVEGGGSLAWQQELTEEAQKTGFIDTIDTDGFVPTEVEELNALANHLSTQKYYFSRSDQLTEDSSSQLQRLKPDLLRLVELDKMLPQLSLEFRVRGFADAAGSPEQHETVRVKRAARMVGYLGDNGILPENIRLISGQPEVADDESQQWRRAEITVEIKQAVQ